MTSWPAARSSSATPATARSCWAAGPPSCCRSPTPSSPAASRSTARSPTTRCGGCGTPSATSTGSTLGDERPAAPGGRALVDRAHAGIPGATDPDRQLWVAATLYRTGVDVYELLRGPMPPALADEVYARERRARHVAAAAARALAGRPRGIRAVLDGCGGRPRGQRRCARGGPRSAAPGARPAVAAGRHAARPHPHRGSAPGIRPRRVRVAATTRARSRRAVRVARLAARLAPRRLRELPSRRLLG